jgi:hypothetical protein
MALDGLNLGLAACSVAVGVWSLFRLRAATKMISVNLWRHLDRLRQLLWVSEDRLKQLKDAYIATDKPRERELILDEYHRWKYLHLALCNFYSQVAVVVSQTTTFFSVRTIRSAISRGLLTSEWQIMQFLSCLPEGKIREQSRAQLQGLLQAYEVDNSERGTHEQGYSEFEIFEHLTAGLEKDFDDLPQVLEEDLDKD